MRYKHPAAIGDGYFYVCDYCETDDCTSTAVWNKLPGRRGHFAICHVCIAKLYMEYVAGEDKVGESIIVRRQAISEKTRNEVFGRDGNKCTKCGVTSNLQIDHVVPFSRGGTSNITNLKTLCRQCNLIKRDKVAG